MIIDDIKHIDKYENIPSNVIEFLKTLSCETQTGHYELSASAYVNVDEYETKPIENCKFEAHKKYIDIQMLLEGEEEIDIISVNGLKISEEYDETRDVMFFENSEKSGHSEQKNTRSFADAQDDSEESFENDVQPDKVRLLPAKFVLIEPYEAHKPQIAVNDLSKKVKKAVVKILA